VRILCVIPVRGGSKGLPRKNALELLDGVSLLEWTIRQAQECYTPDCIAVSTEDKDLAEIACAAGAHVVPRPRELSTDEATTAAVVEHLLEFLDPKNKLFDAIAILQVTSPLRNSDDIRASIELMRSTAYDSVISVFPITGDHPAKMYFLETSSGIQVATPVAPAYETARRQELPRAYRRNGAIFITTRNHFEQTGHLWGGKTGIVEMPQARSIDIDTADDLKAAQQALNASRNEDAK